MLPVWATESDECARATALIAAHTIDRDEPVELAGNEGGAPVHRHRRMNLEPERGEPVLGVAHGRGKLRIVRGHARVPALDVRKLDGRLADVVLLHDRVATLGLPDGAVLECLRARGSAERERQHDEAEPGRECPPGAASAPPAYAGRPPHAVTPQLGRRPARAR
jgi:hypothetical protein